MPHIKEIARVLKPGGHLLVGMPRVGLLMDQLFKLIVFHRSKLLHRSTWRMFSQTAETCFSLEKYVRMPAFLPQSCGLYHSMLFKKL